MKSPPRAFLTQTSRALPVDNSRSDPTPLEAKEFVRLFLTIVVENVYLHNKRLYVGHEPHPVATLQVADKLG